MINLRKNNSEVEFDDPNIVGQPDYICKCGYHKSSCICHLLPQEQNTKLENKLDGLGLKVDSQGFLIHA